jgi:Putative auto-transporter adhesin, head GIN domain
MRRTPLALLLAAVSLAAGLLAIGCDLDGNAGPTKSESRDVATFDRIEVEDRTNVTVRTGPEQQLTLRGGARLLDAVSTTVAEGTLTIDRSARESAELHVMITVPLLRGLASNAGGEIELVDVDADGLELGHDGAGTLTANGRVERLNATLGGAGDLDLAGLTAEHAAVRVSGLGKAEVNVTDELDATISGIGSIEYHGHPAVHRHISGFGDVSPAGA